VLALPAQNLPGCEVRRSADWSQRCQIYRRNPRGFNQILHAWFAMRANGDAEAGMNVRLGGRAMTMSHLGQIV
jgi:hypothetical protein